MNHSAAEPQSKFHRTVISAEGRDPVRTEFQQNKKISPFGRGDDEFVETKRFGPGAVGAKTTSKHSRRDVDCRGGIAYA